jgi:hypothetical protein
MNVLMLYLAKKIIAEHEGRLGYAEPNEAVADSLAGILEDYR